MKHLNVLTKSSIYALALSGLLMSGCKKDDGDPEPENELEVITDVTLIFTNVDDTTEVVRARAQDPDGEGIEDLEILDEINLDVNKNYTLTFEILNALEDPAEDIGDEILDEDDEHQIFFGFTSNSFTSPLGDGNIGDGKASDPINYNDEDENGNKVGLNTSWETSSAILNDGMFRVILKHQPGVKTSSSDSEDGDTDFDLEFVLNIQ